MARRHLDWMAQAEFDLQTARKLSSAGDYEWCCFICQQAAEKAVKAVIESKNGKSKVHSVFQLLKSLKVEDKKVLEAARRLEYHYIQPRYPNGFETGYPRMYYSIEEAERALSDAELIVSFCRNNMKK